MATSSNKLVIIGFDGMDFRYLNKFSNPTFDNFRSEGVSAQLRSSHPTWTGSAWPSMYTGCNPSYHGVYDFYTYPNTYPDNATSVSRQDVQAPALWDYLSSKNRQSVIMNVPVTHPAEEISGTLIPGYLAPSDAKGSPIEIRDEISNAINEEYSIYASNNDSMTDNMIVEKYLDLMRLREEAAEYLLNTKDWEFAFIQVQKTDTVFHVTDETEHFRRVYTAADRILGTILEAVDDDTNIVICSDHGIGPVSGYLVFINEILKEYGYLKTASNINGAVNRNERPNENEMESSLVTKTILNATKELSKVGFTPGRIYKMAQQVGLDEALKNIVPTKIQMQAAESIDWSHSAAFCRRQSEQGIRINLKGRDPNGVVPQSEYESVRTDIINILSNLNTPKGEPVFEFVVPREEFYDGPYTKNACDILFRTTGMNHKVSAQMYGQRMVRKNSHDHKPDGVFMASGPAFNDDYDINKLALTDVAPIVMAAMGYPVPQRMTGSIPTGLLKDKPSTASYDVEYDYKNEYSQDQNEIREQLKDLGYI